MKTARCPRPIRGFAARQSLQVQMLVIGLVALAVTAALFAYLGLQSQQRDVQQRLQEHLLVSRAIASGLDELLDLEAGRLSRASADLGLGTGTPTGDTSTSALKEMFSHTRLFTYGLFVARPTGELVASYPVESQRFPSNISTLNRPAEAPRSGLRTVSNAVQAPDGTPIVITSLAVHNASGETVGVVGGAIDLRQSWMDHYLETMRLQEGRYAEVVDSNGFVLAHTLSERRLAPAYHVEALRPLLDPRRPSAAIVNTGEYGGHEKEAVGVAPLLSAPWMVVLEEDESEFMAPMVQTQQTMVLVGVLAMAFSCAVLWYGARRVTAPLRTLIGATQAVFRGDYDVQLPPGNADELGQLAHSFQLMLERLRQSKQTIDQWNAVLERRVEKRTSELGAVNAIAQAVGESLELRTILHDALATILEVVHVDAACIYLLNQAGDRVETHIHAGASEHFSRAVDDSSVVAKRISALARRGAPTMADDISHEGRDGLPVDEEGLTPLIALPLIAKGAPLGLLVLSSRVPRTFTEDEVELLRSMAGVIAVAIGHSRLYLSSVQTSQQMTAMARIAASITSGLNVAQVYEAFAQEAKSLVDYDRTSIVLADEATGLTRAVALATTMPTRLPSGSTLPLKGNAVEHVIQTGEACIEPDLSSDGRFDEDKLLASDGLRSAIRLPLRTKDGVIGSLNFLSRRKEAYRERDVPLLQQLADHVAVAVENHRLHSQTDEQLRARVWELSHLVSISRIVSGASSLRDILDRAAVESAHIIGFCRCTIGLFDEGSGRLRIRAIHDSREIAGDAVGLLVDPDRRLYLKKALESRSTVVVGAEGDLTADERDVLRRAGVTSALYVPLQAGGKLMGCMFLGSDIAGRAFTPSEVELAEAVASQVAVAIQRARLYQSATAEKRQVEALLTSMSEGVFSTDNELRITAVNPWLAKITGVTADEAVGHRCEEVFRHEDHSGVLLCGTASCPIVSALTSGAPVHRRFTVLRARGGRHATISLSTSPVVDADGSVLGSVNVCRDVSTEWELDRVRGEIIQVLSHELRTPLTSIQGFSELMLTRSFPDAQRQEFLTEINKESERLARLLGDVLDVSRIDSGRMMLHLQPVSLEQAARDCVASLALQLAEHHVVLEIRPDLPSVEADPDRLAQVLSNLVSNAFKYSLAGTEITIKAWAAHEHADGTLGPVWSDGGDPESSVDWVTLEVSDQGVGIPAAHLSHVFEPFHRIDNSLTRSIAGTGLGLAIARRLVVMHGGRIWVQSEEDRGSTFYVALRPARGRGDSRAQAAGPRMTSDLDGEPSTSVT